MPEKKCLKGPCIDTLTVDPARLSRYRILTRLQAIGYCSPSVIEDWQCGICSERDSPVKNTTLVKTFHSRWNTVVGMMGVSHSIQTIFLVIQGTMHNIQWIRCSRGRLVPLEPIFPPFNTSSYSNIKVHYGYQKSWMDLFPLIYDDLNNRIKLFPNYTLSLIGHSFGAGVLGIMTANIALGSLGPLMTPARTEFISLGASRIGNVAYAQLMDSSGFKDLARIVHSTDLVPHMPFLYKYQRISYILMSCRIPSLQGRIMAK
jgi:hypothetical protein